MRFLTTRFSEFLVVPVGLISIHITIISLSFILKKCVFLGYSSEHKGYKCFHVPTNHLFISQDVVFDETVFPFAALPSPASEPTPMHSSSVLHDQFVDVVHSPILLSNHGAGIDLERGACLELLEDSSPIAYVSPVIAAAGKPAETLPRHSNSAGGRSTAAAAGCRATS
jgi:hypothetical protein